MSGERGRVEGIALTPTESGPLREVERADAIAGRGLDGDRYAIEGQGFSEKWAGKQDITLIEAEALEGLAADGIELSHAESRRNVLVRGISLNELVGRRFAIGEVECEGIEPADPCNHLEKLTREGVLRGLVDRGGLRAGIIRGGTIAVGDEVRVLQP